MSIYTILERLEFLRGEPAALLVVIAAALAIAAWDMRVVLPALAVQYLASFLLFVDVLDPRLAIVYLFIGIIVTLIMTITAAQVNWGRAPANLTPTEHAQSGSSFLTIGPFRLTPQQLIRLVLAIAVPIGLYLWSRTGELPALATLPPPVQFAVFGLVALGLVGIATGGPLFGGVGVLIFLNGFDLFNSSVEQSIALVIGLSAANLLVALTIAYLAQARAMLAGPVE
ncbi:MAG: hypothetical protein R3C44_03390 [Chloroflexota bacterium]